jgi:hypothetical protein
MAFMMPLAQLPIFISFYFGMTTMGDYFPLLSEGGAFWFPDLTVKDETWGLPVINSLLFAGMAQVGSAEMKASQQNMFKWGLRGMAVILLPMLAHLPSSLFVYFISQVRIYTVTVGITFLLCATVLPATVLSPVNGDLMLPFLMLILSTTHSPNSPICHILDPRSPSPP